MAGEKRREENGGNKMARELWREKYGGRKMAGTKWRENYGGRNMAGEEVRNKRRERETNSFVVQQRHAKQIHLTERTSAMQRHAFVVHD